MGTLGYSSVFPPCGHGDHRYFFKMYALDRHLSLSEGATKYGLEKALQVHVVAMAELMGLYARA